MICTNTFANQSNNSNVIDDEVMNIRFNIAQKVQEMVFNNIVILDVEIYYTSVQ